MKTENTLIMYSLKDNENNEFIYEGIADVYKKYKTNIIQIYSEQLDLENNTCVGAWKDAYIIKADAIQEIQIYFVPDGFTIEEWKDVIRVTPNTIFPVKTREGKIIDKAAYLLETGDELLFEDSQYNSDNNGEVLDKQNIMFRSIAKVIKENLDDVKQFYTFKFIFNDNKYYLLPNGNIIKSIDF